LLHFLKIFFEKALDIDEMINSEGITSSREKYETRMQAKKDQIQSLLPNLHYFKNESFKFRVAELIQWISVQLGKYSSFKHQVILLFF